MNLDSIRLQHLAAAAFSALSVACLALVAGLVGNVATAIIGVVVVVGIFMYLAPGGHDTRRGE